MGLEKFIDRLFLRYTPPNRVKANELSKVREVASFKEAIVKSHKLIIYKINRAIAEGLFETEFALRKEGLSSLDEFEKLGYTIDILVKNEFENNEFPVVKIRISWK